MHITTHPFSTHHTFSILSVLPQCDSAMNVLSIHPFLITLLLNQLSKRSHTTVLRFHSSFWICWSECAQRCLVRNESLFASILLRNDLHITRWTVNVFDYILLAILTSNRSFGHLRCAKNGQNLHIHQLHSLDSIYSSCISHPPIRKILWWERCWSWVWWMWRKKWAWWRKEGEATARMVAFVESMMCAGRCSKSPTFGKSIERITHRAGAEGIDCLHFVHQGLESG